MRCVRTWAWVAILITLSDTKMWPREGYILFGRDTAREK